MECNDYNTKEYREKNYFVNIDRVLNGWQVRTAGGTFVIQDDGTSDITKLLETIESIIKKYE